MFREPVRAGAAEGNVRKTQHMYQLLLLQVCKKGKTHYLPIETCACIVLLKTQYYIHTST